MCAAARPPHLLVAPLAAAAALLAAPLTRPTTLDARFLTAHMGGGKGQQGAAQREATASKHLFAPNMSHRRSAEPAPGIPAATPEAAAPAEVPAAPSSAASSRSPWLVLGGAAAEPPELYCFQSLNTLLPTAAGSRSGAPPPSQFCRLCILWLAKALRHWRQAGRLRPSGGSGGWRVGEQGGRRAR